MKKRMWGKRRRREKTVRMYKIGTGGTAAVAVAVTTIATAAVAVTTGGLEAE